MEIYSRYNCGKIFFLFLNFLQFFLGLSPHLKILIFNSKNKIFPFLNLFKKIRPLQLRRFRPAANVCCEVK